MSIDGIRQRLRRLGLTGASRTQMAFAEDSEAGIRWHVWRRGRDTIVPADQVAHISPRMRFDYSYMSEI